MSEAAASSSAGGRSAAASSIKVLADGCKEFMQQDGTKIVVNAKGTIIKQTSPDGTILEINPDMDVKKEVKKSTTEGGEEGEEDDDDDDMDDIPKVLWLQKQTFPDGTVLEMYKNNITVQINPDKSRVTSHPGGVTHFDAKTGDTRHRFLDGYELHELADGTTIDIEPGGTRRQVNPDNTEIHTNKDGSKVIVKDGNERVVPAPGS